MQQTNQRAVLNLCLAALVAVPPMAGCSKLPEPTATAPAAAAAVEGEVRDIDVTEHVKTALQQSTGLKAFDIQVVTLKGDVRLIGVLDSQTQVDEAVRIARTADGAHTIHDELVVKK